MYIPDTDNIKQKNKKPWNNTKQIFPEQKTKKSFVLHYLCPVQDVLGCGNLDSINIWTNCQFIWSLSQESVHLTVSLGISKTMPLATMSKQAHACWEFKYWSPSTWLVCGHFIQIHSCISEYLFLMHTLYKSPVLYELSGLLKDMFTVRSSSYNLRGNHILALPNPKTTTYGLHSFSYLASKVWNSLPDTYKTLNFLEFKQEILRYEAFPQ